MKEDVLDALNAWLPALRLPPDPGSSTKDLKGQRIRVSRFSDEESVRFFFPRRSLIFQQRLIKALTARLRQRGAKIDTFLPTAENYRLWLEASGKEDSPALRYQFASAPPID